MSRNEIVRGKNKEGEAVSSRGLAVGGRGSAFGLGLVRWAVFPALQTHKKNKNMKEGSSSPKTERAQALKNFWGN
jgi:hypothetical protein